MTEDIISNEEIVPEWEQNEESVLQEATIEAPDDTFLTEEEILDPELFKIEGEREMRRISMRKYRKDKYKTKFRWKVADVKLIVAKGLWELVYEVQQATKEGFEVSRRHDHHPHEYMGMITLPMVKWDKTSWRDLSPYYVQMLKKFPNQFGAAFEDLASEEEKFRAKTIAAKKARAEEEGEVWDEAVAMRPQTKQRRKSWKKTPAAPKTESK